MASTSNSWMPAQGRHQVNIGTSLGRALKARKGTTATKRSNLPDRDFFSFRYNFKPESIDSAKPGTIEVKKGKDSTSVMVERSSSQAGEGHVFIGTEQPAKEWECVLIYDEEMGTFTLEKLDSFMILHYDGRINTSINRPSPNPPASRNPNPDIDFEAQLEHDSQGVEDAEGEPDVEFLEIFPHVAARQEEEEDEEEGEISAPAQNTPPSPPKPKARAPKPLTKVEGPPPKPKTPGKGKAKAKREHEAVVAHTSLVEEEDLEFGRPARQTKRSRPSPTGEGLALPGGLSSSFPDPLAHATARTPARKISSASRSVVRPPSPPVAAPMSDSDEDWDEVHAGEPPATSERMRVDSGDAEGEDEEEIDMNAFEAEMNQHLGQPDEDFLAAAVSPEPETPVGGASGRPISLNQFAGGEASQDDDDYSSSEDSEED